MENKLEVSFNSPQCGWMSIGFEDGAGEFHTTTAHAPHKFALPELLRILAALLDEKSEQNEYLLKWSRDPEEFDFQFLREGGSLLLEIYQYPTEERHRMERELVFSHAGTVKDVCKAFLATFEQLCEDRNTDEFEFNWRQPFPHPEFVEFKTKVAKSRFDKSLKEMAKDQDIQAHLRKTND